VAQVVFRSRKMGSGNWAPWYVDSVIEPGTTELIGFVAKWCSLVGGKGSVITITDHGDAIEAIITPEATEGDDAEVYRFTSRKLLGDLPEGKIA